MSFSLVGFVVSLEKAAAKGYFASFLASQGSELSSMSGPELNIVSESISVHTPCPLPLGLSCPMSPSGIHCPRAGLPPATLAPPGNHASFCVSMGSLWIIHYDNY